MFYRALICSQGSSFESLRTRGRLQGEETAQGEGEEGLTGCDHMAARAVRTAPARVMARAPRRGAAAARRAAAGRWARAGKRPRKRAATTKARPTPVRTVARPRLNERIRTRPKPSRWRETAARRTRIAVGEGMRPLA